MRAGHPLHFPTTHALEQTLSSYAPLPAGELALVRNATISPRSHAVNAQIEAAPPGTRRAVLSGWVGRINQFPDGRRQVLSLCLPGDLLDSRPVAGLQLGHFALTNAQTADVTGIMAACRRETPDFALARAWRALEDEQRERQARQIVRLGRLSAYERTASLFVELHERQRRSGQADASSMPMPLTQEMLSDILALSVVHVNRILQQLRHDGLIVYRASKVMFSDLPALRVAAAVGE
jgi:CRP-like cAMP-binding protein